MTLNKMNLTNRSSRRQKAAWLMDDVTFLGDIATALQTVKLRAGLSVSHYQYLDNGVGLEIWQDHFESNTLARFGLSLLAATMESTRMAA